MWKLTGEIAGQFAHFRVVTPRMPDSLEKLDLLLLTVARARKVHPDGIRYEGLRYVDPTLAAYAGESVTLRYDPRDMAEIRVFHQERFICRAICPDLRVSAGYKSAASRACLCPGEHRGLR
jgi:hypothetical protein